MFLVDSFLGQDRRGILHFDVLRRLAGRISRRRRFRTLLPDNNKINGLLIIIVELKFLAVVAAAAATAAAVEWNV